MMHVHCGDSSAETLRKAEAAGEVVVWCDPVFEGPTPAGVSGDEWRRMRANYLAGQLGDALTADQIAERFRREQTALEQFRDHDEVVLWFDACLFDQAILIRQLAWFGERDLGDTRLSLIAIGAFPGFERFRGLGELDPAQLGSLLDTRHEVAPAETDLARRAWTAFCSPDPTAIERLLDQDTRALPFLADALRRHLEQFPSVRNGLNRLENEALAAVAAGCAKPTAIFRYASDREERPFFGDTTLWACLDDLARAPSPALTIDGPSPLPRWAPKDIDRWTIALTPFGRDLLADRTDWLRANGLDRWLGGVHLEGKKAAWRWDERRSRLARPERRG
jgi:hypothetical protein